MIVKLEASELNKAIKRIEKMVNKKATMPQLNCVKLASYNNKIVLVANNLESAVEIELNGNVEQSGEVLIHSDDFKLFAKTKNQLLTIEGDWNLVSVKGTRTFQYVGYDPAGFPVFHNKYEKDVFTITANELLRAFKIKTLCGTDIARPSLTGLCICENKVWASNSYLCGEYVLPVDNNTTTELILPKKSVDEIEKIIGRNYDDELTFKYHADKNKKYLSVTGTGWTYMTRLIDGTFIDTKRIFPMQSDTDITVDREKFIDTLDFAKTMGVTVTDNGKYTLDFKTVDGKLQLSGNTATKSMKESLSSEVMGKDVDLHFSVDYLIQCVKLLEDKELCLKFNNCFLWLGNDTERYMIASMRK